MQKMTVDASASGVTHPVELALNLAAIVMRNGGSTSMADRTFNHVLEGCGQGGISAVWRLDLVAASGVIDGQRVTGMRPIGVIGVNLMRASEAAVLGERVARGEITTAALATEVERINALPAPYGRWARIAAAACAAATFSQLAGGDWGALGVVFVAAGVGQGLRSLLQARKLAVAPVTLICGMLSACIVAAGLRLGLSHTPPAAAIASVIYLAPGLPLINGFIDVVSQKYLLVGLERIASAAFIFLVLVIAIAFASAVVAGAAGGG